MGRQNQLEVTMKLKDLETLLGKVNPFFKVIPIKVTTNFPSLTEEEKLDLQDLANMEEGKAERWLLVPDSIPLYTLGFVVNRAFGLIPDPMGNFFTLTDKDWDEKVRTMDRFLSLSGNIFDNPPDMEYMNAAAALCMASGKWFPPVPMALMVPSKRSYKESQKELEEAFADLKRDGVPVDGKVIPFHELSADLEAVADKIKDPEKIAISDNLCPELELRCVLQEKGKKLWTLDEQKKERKASMGYDRVKARPFLDELCMYTFDEEGYVAYEFTVTRPKDVHSLIEEGFLSTDDYLESIAYVSSSMLADCICKKGYDLFGPDPIFYHDFIMAIHGPERESYLEEAAKLEWKEPYVDLKKVLR